MGAHGQLPALGALRLSRAGAARVLGRRALLGVCACLAALAATAAASARAIAEGWSDPQALSACAGAGTPLAVFPSDSPTHATGPGALVWSAGAGCPGGEGAWISALGPDDAPLAVAGSAQAGRPLSLRGPLSASGAPYGQIVIAGSRPACCAAAVVQGIAGAPFASLAAGSGAIGPPLLSRAYLGDVALAARASDGSGLLLRVERHYERAFGPWVAVGSAAHPQAATVALDFRSDALAAWQQAGSLYLRDLPASGVAQPLQRLAPAAADVRVAALLSDDDRAIVAWSDRRGEDTSVYVELSATGVRFGTPTLLERYRDPGGAPPPTASPTLVRLRSEGVLLAWAGAAAGHWVVRVAAVDLLGVRSVSTIAAPDAQTLPAGLGGDSDGESLLAGTGTSPDGDALLAGLAAAPDGGALALWTEPQNGEGAAQGAPATQLMAARVVGVRPGRTAFGPPEAVAPPGAVLDPSVAFDPSSDRAVAVWRDDGGGIAYAVRSTGASP